MSPLIWRPRIVNSWVHKVDGGCQGWGRGKRALLCSGDRDSVGEDENALEVDDGGAAACECALGHRPVRLKNG